MVDGDILGLLCGGISGRRVRQLAEEGIFPKAKANLYDAIVCVPAFWLWKSRDAKRAERQPGALDPEQQRARKEKELADAAALKNAQTRGELVSAAEAERAWIEMIGIARERLLAMPSKLGPALAAMTKAPEVQSAIEDEVRTALAELAGASVVGHDGSGPDGEGSPSI